MKCSLGISNFLVMCWGTFLCEPSSKLLSFFGLCPMLLRLLCLTWDFVPSAHLDI